MKRSYPKEGMGGKLERKSQNYFMSTLYQSKPSRKWSGIGLFTWILKWPRIMIGIPWERMNQELKSSRNEGEWVWAVCTWQPQVEILCGICWWQAGFFWGGNDHLEGTRGTWNIPTPWQGSVGVGVQRKQSPRGEQCSL